MLDLHSLTFMVILLSFSSSSTRAQQQTITSPQQLDLLIRNYTFNGSLINNMTKTGEIQSVHLPPNLSGAVRARAGRFRCGSLTRYGARIDEFHLGIGVSLFPCVERVMLIAHNLDINWSISIYSATYYNLSGYYKLVSPILSLTAFNAGKKSSLNPNSSYPFEVGIRSAQGNPITVNFTNTIDGGTIQSPLCASFGRDGKTVTLKPPISPYVCGSTSNGHFGLLVKLPPPPPAAVAGEGGGGRVATWKVAVGSSVGSALGIVLLGLLLVAMFAKVKKKARMVEMERRAYEEEALQVSMVGHVRAPVAAGTRTAPTIEHRHHFVHYNPNK